MSFTTMSAEEAAEYLHLDMRQLNKLIQRREIPYEIIRGQVTFRKNHLRDWSTTRILAFKDKHLHEFHTQAHNKQEAPDRHQPFLNSFVLFTSTKNSEADNFSISSEAKFTLSNLFINSRPILIL